MMLWTMMDQTVTFFRVLPPPTSTRLPDMRGGLSLISRRVRRLLVAIFRLLALYSVTAPSVAGRPCKINGASESPSGVPSLKST